MIRAYLLVRMWAPKVVVVAVVVVVVVAVADVLALAVQSQYLLERKAPPLLPYRMTAVPQWAQLMQPAHLSAAVRWAN